MAQKSKKCTKCGEQKPSGAFRPDDRTDDGIAEICWDCRSMAEVSEKPWGSITEADYADAADFCSACLIDLNPPGEPKSKALCKLPIKEPKAMGGKVNKAAIAAAKGRLNQTQAPAAAKAKAKASLERMSRAMSEGRAMPLTTVDIPGVDLLAVGGPYHGSGSPAKGDYFQEADLAEIAKANNELADEVRPYNKIGHSSEQRLARASGLIAEDESPATGWLKNFRVEEGKLRADAYDVPQKLADLIRARAFRTRSVEMRPYTSQHPEKGEKKYPWVVTALAWLGAKAPAVRTLDDVSALYADVTAVPEEEVRTVDYTTEDEEGVVEFDENGNVIGPLTVIAPDELIVNGNDFEARVEAAVRKYAAEFVKKDGEPADTRERGDMTGLTFTDEQIASLRESLGLDDETDPETILEKAAELREKADAEPAIPEGRALSEEEFASLKSDAEAGKLAARALFQRDRDDLLSKAVETGKIKVADREKWEKRYEDDPVLIREVVTDLPEVDKTAVLGDDGLDEAARSAEDRQFAEFADYLGIPEEARV